jgi:hypothetical protein
MVKLKEVGCHRMSIGLEHGNEDFRHRLLKKRYKNEQIRSFLSIISFDQVRRSVETQQLDHCPMEDCLLAVEQNGDD